MRHDLVRALVQHYLERVGYAGRFRLLTRFSDFEQVARRRGVTEIPDEHKDFGMCLPNAPVVIWVNVPEHRSIAQLADTAAHEALHVTGMRHGPQFDKTVRRLLRGGRL